MQLEAFAYCNYFASRHGLRGEQLTAAVEAAIAVRWHVLDRNSQLWARDNDLANLIVESGLKGGILDIATEFCRALEIDDLESKDAFHVVRLMARTLHCWSERWAA